MNVTKLNCPQHDTLSKPVIIIVPPPMAILVSCIMKL